MALITGKPYVFLDEVTTGQKSLSVIAYCNSITYVNEVIQNNTLIVKYNVSISGTLSIQSPATNPRVLTNSGYTKIAVRFYDSGTLIGSSTIPLINPTAYESNPYNIHCYLKSVPTAGTHLYFYVDMTGSGYLIPNNPSEVSLLPNENKMILYFDERTGTGGAINRNVSLANYDPSTYNRIEVKIRNSTLTKGKGTTDQSDADASGDN
jgi:hypothetical protein